MSQRSFELGPFRFAIRSTSETFAAWLDEVLASYRGAESADPHYSVVVADADADDLRGDRLHVLYRGCKPLIRTLDLGTLARVLLADIQHPLLAERDDALYAEAATVRIGDVTVLVPTSVVTELGRLGRSAQRRGLQLPVAMRSLAVDPVSGRLLPLPSLLDSAEQAFAALPQPRRSNGHRERVGIDQPQSVDFVCTPAATPGGNDTVWPHSRAAVLHEFAAAMLNHAQIGAQRGLDGLARLVGRTRCYGIRAKTPGDLAAALTRAVAEA